MVMLRKSLGTSLLGILATGCILLMALSVQRGAAVPINTHCRLNKTDFEPYIANRTYMLANKASLGDDNTDVRLIGKNLSHDVHVSKHCYLMKQVLNFTLEEVLLPWSDRFQPYMKDVVPFMAKLNNKLKQCNIQSGHQNIQRKVQKLKDTVEKLGESGKIKVVGELYLLFQGLKDTCA
ncbi:interleukin-22 [Rhynchocyon petersi]